MFGGESESIDSSGRLVDSAVQRECLPIRDRSNASIDADEIFRNPSGLSACPNKSVALDLEIGPIATLVRKPKPAVRNVSECVTLRGDVNVFSDLCGCRDETFIRLRSHYCRFDFKFDICRIPRP